MSKLLLSLLFLSFSAIVKADADTLKIEMNASRISHEDTLLIEADLADDQQVSKLATLHLWIEELKTGRQWHYRYPLLNGHLSASLKVSSSMAEGQYAFNFSVQKKFFSFKGKIDHPIKSDEQKKTLTYVLIAKDKESMVDVVKLNNDLSFIIPNLLFQDSAFIIFSRPGQKKNELELKVETPLDSAFSPLFTISKMMTVCKDTLNCSSTAATKNLTANSGYTFVPQNDLYKTILPTITITGKSKKTIDDFEKENVSGVFSGMSDFSIDGITTDEMSNAGDLFYYLCSKIPGLRAETDNESGMRYLTWRKKPTALFLNEIKMDFDAPLDINPADIALIKVYRPGMALTAGSGEGGTIAIYLKNGDYAKPASGRYRFYIKGYTGVNAEWK